MRIVHISTSSGGGAGTAAWRLHNSLLEIGVDSKFVHVHGMARDTGCIRAEPVHQRRWLRLVKRVLPEVDVQIRNSKSIEGLGRNYEIYSFPNSSFSIEDHPLIQECDVINLHWIAGMINFPVFFRKVKTPIIWTLHDMQPFLGGFHYRNDESDNIDLFRNVDERIRAIKYSAYRESSIRTIVAPSRWLLEECLKSKVFHGLDHLKVPYGLDLDLFRPIPQKSARSVLNLPLHKKIVLFVSENVSNKRKGFEYLRELQDEPQSEDCLFVAVGKKPIDILDNILYLGPIHDDRMLAVIYSCADIFLLPSLEDNLPNVMLEAMACGLPVLGFPVGGIKETIIHQSTGLITDTITINSLKKYLQEFLRGEHQFDRNKIRDFALANFDKRTQAVKYLNVYRKLARVTE